MGRSHRSIRHATVDSTNSSTCGVDSKHQAGSNRTKPASVQAIDGQDVRQELPYWAKAAFSTIVRERRQSEVDGSKEHAACAGSWKYERRMSEFEESTRGAEEQRCRRTLVARPVFRRTCIWCLPCRNTVAHMRLYARHSAWMGAYGASSLVLAPGEDGNCGGARREGWAAGGNHQFRARNRARAR